MLARRVKRDAKSVHADRVALVKAGALDEAEGRPVVLPCQSVKVEVLLQAA